MTVAAIEARALAASCWPLTISSCPRRSTPWIIARRALEPAWQMDCGGDLAFCGNGPRTMRQHLLGSYVLTVQRAATDDPEMTRAFVRVAGLVDPPQTLLRPAVLRSVLAPGALPAPRPLPLVQRRRAKRADPRCGVDRSRHPTAAGAGALALPSSAGCDGEGAGAPVPAPPSTA